MKLFITALFLLSSVLASDVLDLTAKDFEAKTKGKNTHIKFYAPWCGHCKALAPKWEQYATAMKDTGVQVAKVDCTTQQAVCDRFSVSGYPTLIFTTEDGKAYEYNGARDVEELKKFAQDPSTGSAVTVKPPAKPVAEVDEKDVLVLTDANFEQVIKGKKAAVKFYAPWCGFCKKIKGDWAQFATDLKAAKSDVLVAHVNCDDKTVNKRICKEYDIRSFPTLYYIDENYDAFKYPPKTDRNLESFKEWLEDPTIGEQLERPFTLNTGIPIVDDNFPMFRDDVIVLYKFKKLALSVVFGLGAVFGMLLCCMCGGSSKSAGKKKTE